MIGDDLKLSKEMEEFFGCDLAQCKQNRDGICKGSNPSECPKNNEQSIYEYPELLSEV